MAPNRTTTSGVSEALKERVGRLLAVADHLSKWSFTIPAEKGARGKMLFWETRLAAVRTLEKGKGCDIGYALAISSCEGANSVDACTVTAL